MLALHDLYISWVSSFRFLDKLSSTCGWKGGYDCDDDDCNLGNTRAAKTRSGLNSVVCLMLLVTSQVTKARVVRPQHARDCGWKGGYDCDDDDGNLGNTRAAKTQSGEAAYNSWRELLVVLNSNSGKKN